MALGKIECRFGRNNRSVDGEYKQNPEHLGDDKMRHLQPDMGDVSERVPA
jgi:hypothetical protein